jgi:hypothetical protein
VPAKITSKPAKDLMLEILNGCPVVRINKIWPVDALELQTVQFLFGTPPAIVGYQDQFYACFGQTEHVIGWIQNYLNGNRGMEMVHRLCPPTYYSPKKGKDPTELFEELELLGVRYIKWFAKGVDKPYYWVLTDDLSDVVQWKSRHNGEIGGGQVHSWFWPYVVRLLSYYVGNLPPAVKRLAPLFGVRYDEVVEDGQTVFVRSQMKK